MFVAGQRIVSRATTWNGNGESVQSKESRKSQVRSENPVGIVEAVANVLISRIPSPIDGDVIHQDHDYDGNKIQPEVAKPFKAPSALVDTNKKVTEFFTVRRSVRKTKKEVQEERMRNIEQAIREGREEGLEVRH